ncbi:MAG TPA: hypothetical protein VHZ07_10355 [Bryobacteraceae bacterium]|nr:hypothetical protein [Bryobacteraceae bacterium]
MNTNNLSNFAKRIKRNRIIPAALFGISMFWLFGATLHSDQWGETGPANPGSSDAAIERFWTVYHGNDYDSIPEVQAELQAALQHDPNNATLYALLGATHFWHIGEYTRDPKPDQNVLQSDMPTAAALFGKAFDLDYYGQHLIGYINDDHLPGYLGITTVHVGQMSNNPNLIAQGDKMLDFAAYQFPEFNNFNRWAAHNTDSKDSVTYHNALESLWQGLDACVGGSIDRTNPDVGPYLNLQTSVGRKKACWSEGDIAPHSFEGYMLNLGNGLVKADQINVAKIVYANARYAKNYETWPYRQVLEAIEASDLNARALLYADGDPSNDPPLGVPNRSCVYCHATVPEPNPH